MSDSEENIIDEEPPTESRRGRPVGKTDSTQRSRRTAQEISDDKIRIAQMKLDAVREAEERKLANKKTRSGPQKIKAAQPRVQEIAMPARVQSKKPREDSLSPSPKHVSYASRKEALYDSFFTPRRRS